MTPPSRSLDASTRALASAILVVAVVTAAVRGSNVRAASEPGTSTFADEIARLSEPDGFFDTDNLISNERTYLHAVDALRARKVSGGVYIGVGPDQNFSYIAQIRPARAYIVDIRRDNLLAHLLFKAVFELSPTRIEYLTRLFGRPPPAQLAGWESADVESLAAYVDETPVDDIRVEAVQAEIAAQLTRFGVPLSEAHRATIARFHRTFISQGLSLRFHSLGRPPRPHYPTYRELLVGTDQEGTPASYLADRTAYQFVRSLQQRDLIVPVVGDLAGDHTLRALAELLAGRGEQVSAFYTSNVEFYLFQRGRAGAYLANLAALPRGDGGVAIRSVFGRMGQPMARGRSYSYSVPVVQGLDDLVDGFATGRYRSYWDLVR